jgi:uncharacterized protein
MVLEVANRRKHDVGFADASTVFGDPLSITVSDPDHAAGQERLVIIGMSSERKPLVVGYFQSSPLPSSWLSFIL